ncbi:MAG: site-specific integrase, partial [Proteobacteria bacterium]|nr:site-specific integrase [Pseudomonadota bacterium]
KDIIYIRRAMGMDQGDIKEPKTGPREIPLSDAVSGLLESMPKPKRVSEWAFPNPRTGRPYTKNCYKIWKLACAAAGAMYVKPYAAFRHSFASQMAEAGAGSMAIRELMGHADIRTTTIYTHHRGDALKLAVDRVQRLPGATESVDAKQKKG